MTAVDWSNFGQFVHDEMKNNTCLGKFYKEGIENAVETTRDGVKYGYQFWVYNVNGKPTLTMTGHGGFFNIVDVASSFKRGSLFIYVKSLLNRRSVSPTFPPTPISATFLTFEEALFLEGKWVDFISVLFCRFL
jgi:hypothetical protein